MVNASSGLTEGRVAIVTGGSRGIGLATVRLLARLGYAVVVGYVHDQRNAESAVDAVLAGNGTAVAVRADVGDDLDVDRLFAETAAALGPVDAIVHTVRGRVTPTAVAATSLDVFDTLWMTSTRATFIVNRAAAREVRNGGAIVNLSGSVANSALPAYGAYAANAAAVRTLVRVLAVELRERDVTVNGVSFGIDRPTQPGRIAALVAHLFSPEGHAISGDVIDLDDRAPVDGRRRRW
jgi:3-oxoacyl-[acyl-carrier protein] reductase